MTHKIYFMEHDEVASLIPDKLTVSIVGFGYIGTCLGALIAAKGVEVFGIDTNDKIVEEINAGTSSIEEPRLLEHIRHGHEAEKLKASLDYESISVSDVIIVTVGTPLEENLSPDLGHIIGACKNIGKNLEEGSLVIIKSTIPPYTTEGQLKKVLEENSRLQAGKQFGLVFSPERINEGNAIGKLSSLPIIVGGINEKSSQMAALFWEKLLGVETIIVENPTTAEMAKLADNLWIDLNIAVANEIALLCDKYDIDAYTVIRAANTLPKGQHLVNILYPSFGVGGYCLTKDPWFVHKIGKDHGLDLKTPVCSRSVNDLMPEFAFHHIKECIEQIGLQLNQASIAILGLAFTNNTGDVRFTPVKPLIKKLWDSGCSMKVFDPLVPKENVKTITDAEIGEDVFSSVSGVDLIACLAGHREFVITSLSALKEKTKTPCWFFDGRRSFDARAVKDAGFLYTGIGRRCHGRI